MLSLSSSPARDVDESGLRPVLPSEGEPGMYPALALLSLPARATLEAWPVFRLAWGDSRAQAQATAIWGLVGFGSFG